MTPTVQVITLYNSFPELELCVTSNRINMWKILRPRKLNIQQIFILLFPCWFLWSVIKWKIKFISGKHWRVCLAGSTVRQLAAGDKVLVARKDTTIRSSGEVIHTERFICSVRNWRASESKQLNCFYQSMKHLSRKKHWSDVKIGYLNHIYVLCHYNVLYPRGCSLKCCQKFVSILFTWLEDENLTT